MQLLKLSTAATTIVGPILDSAGAEYTGAVIGDLSITKNGTTAAMAAAATLTHISNAYYTLVFTTGNTDTLGRLDITCNKSTYQMPPKSFMVHTANVFDALVAGTDYLEVDAFFMDGEAAETFTRAQLEFYQLDKLFQAAIVGANVVDNSFAARLVSKSATADWDSYSNTTDSLEALRDRGDAAWLTATGFSTHSAADVWAVATRVLTAGTNINGSTFTAIPWNAAWDAEVQSEVQDAIEVNHLDHLLAVDYDPTSKPGVATALLNEMVGSDAGVSQWTANALELGPSGGGNGSTLTAIPWNENWNAEVQQVLDLQGVTIAVMDRLDWLAQRHLNVVIDASDGLLYVKDNAGNVISTQPITSSGALRDETVGLPQ